ncbi:MAG: prepilin-type N-terminal cleavage/methylation domain-containing protein [Gammaproteobacteria bacterium]|nr:prepilin-type N-terminal cleavage/methylation domain-containing protein [Gammaproteobacteria bacterium]
MSNTCSDQAKGFTLVEVLIALTLLGIMMTLFMSSFRAGVRNWEAGESLASATGDRFVVQNFLRSYLENARPVIDDFTEENESEFSFRGDNHSVIFVAGLPANQDKGGLWRFSIGLDKEGRSKELVVNVEPFYPELDEDAELSETLTLLSNIERFDVYYFGKDQPTDQDEDWNEDWEDKNELPSLIKIDLQIKDQKQWPEIIIAPQVEASINSGDPVGRNNRTLQLSNQQNNRQTQNNRQNQGNRSSQNIGRGRQANGGLNRPNQ